MLDTTSQHKLLEGIPTGWFNCSCSGTTLQLPEIVCFWLYITVVSYWRPGLWRGCCICAREREGDPHHSTDKPRWKGMALQFVAWKRTYVWSNQILSFCWQVWIVYQDNEKLLCWWNIVQVKWDDWHEYGVFQLLYCWSKGCLKIVLAWCRQIWPFLVVQLNGLP